MVLSEAASNHGLLSLPPKDVDRLISEISASEWLLLALAGLGVGISKSGLAGFGMIHVIIFAAVFGGKDSTGILLPLLVVGDVCAVKLFGKEVQWRYVKMLLPISMVGVVIGWSLMKDLESAAVTYLIGWIILGLSSLQIIRLWKPALLGNVPHSMVFGIAAGLLTGFTTMIANAAGPVIALYLLAISMPKLALVGTCAWLFLMLNTFKIPFSYQQGLISGHTLLINLVIVPAVVAGINIGRAIVHRIPQKLFDSLLLAFTVIASLRMIGFWNWLLAFAH